MFPSTGSLRRAYRPAYGGACGRYAAGEGTTPCWAAPLAGHGRAGRPGKAARGELGEGNTPVLPGPPKADSPAYCRLPVGAKARLLAFKPRSTLSSNARKVRGAGEVSLGDELRASL